MWAKVKRHKRKAFLHIGNSKDAWPINFHIVVSSTSCILDVYFDVETDGVCMLFIYPKNT